MNLLLITKKLKKIYCEKIFQIMSQTFLEEIQGFSLEYSLD